MGSKAVMHILSLYRLSRIAPRSALWLTSGLGLGLFVCIPLGFASAQKSPAVSAKQRVAGPPTWSVCDSSSAGIRVTDATGLVYTCGATGEPETKPRLRKTSQGCPQVRRSLLSQRIQTLLLLLQTHPLPPRIP